MTTKEQGESSHTSSTPRGDAEPIGVGIIGCGNIFGSYIYGLRKLHSARVLGCADLDQARAEACAKAEDVRAYPSVEALLDDKSIEIVVNITWPLAHAAVSIEALSAGKHVYSEKPLAATLADGGLVLDATSAGGRLGCAPDTFLAAPGQTARAAIDAGRIGEPIGFSATIPHSRAEEWHPDPTFLFERGGGPLLDMGPYYVANLVNCLGPVEIIEGASRIGANPRRVSAPGRLVEEISVEVPTHAVAIARFRSGVIGTITASFDLWSDHLPHIEVYGTDGILRLPDPDRFDGTVLVKENAGDEWNTVAPVIRLVDWTAADHRLRGLGVADLIDSLAGRPQRTSAAFAYHVLEILESIEVSSRNETPVRLASTPPRPEPVRPGDLDGKAAAPQENATDTTKER